MAKRLLGYGIPIFMLHRAHAGTRQGAGGTNPEHLRRCMQYLVDNQYIFISLQQLVLAIRNGDTLPYKSVVFTMDDGYTDQAQIVAPVFIEYGCPLTFFVITGILDQAIWTWDAKIAWIFETTELRYMETRLAGQELQLDLDGGKGKHLAKRRVLDLMRDTDARLVPELVSQLAGDADLEIPEIAPPQFQAMTWDMARKLETQGVRFAPHSVTHGTLSRLSDSSLRREILLSWETLGKELVDPVKIFCYPTGRASDFGIREMQILEENGYLGAVSTVPMLVETGTRSRDRLFCLPRIALPDNMDNFIQCCTWVEYAKQLYHR
jgi:peptidoglycan/xylan/chitin deacetylase (PgdA/CDA1 family)